MREKHSFQFFAYAIAEAATAEAKYHREREVYWQGEYETALATVKKAVGVEIREFDVTGGKRVDFYVSYGDPADVARWHESYAKIDNHRELAERYETDALVYSTQGSRTYELDTNDLHHFRLGKQPREE